jgi:glycerophosphoryl diester phosphodiesterase
MLVIAHRGDSAHRPENTLAAFQGAVEAGVELVELDVQLTRDGHVVVIHDPTVDRTTNGQGPVAGMDLAELRRLSAGFPARFAADYAGERVPTLAEALAFLRGRVRVMVEIKGDSVTDDALGGIEARVIEEVRRQDMAAELALISFDTRALRRCRDLGPEIVRGHLFARSLEGAVAASLEVGAQVLMPHKSLLSPRLAEETKTAGLKLATWVVDDPEELPALRRFPLYGVASNRPGVLLEALPDENVAG